MGDIYSNSKIIERIKTERKSIKLSQEAFAAALGYTRKTINSWEKGKTFPQLSDLLNMCNLFDCDLGYLLCEYDCKTRENTDIVNATGLSESTVNIIKFMDQQSKLPANDIFDCMPAKYKNLLHTIDILIQSSLSDDVSVLGLICSYLYGKYSSFETNLITGNENCFYNIDELRLWDNVSNTNILLNEKDIMNVLLISIQTILQQERDKIQSNSSAGSDSPKKVQNSPKNDDIR